MNARVTVFGSRLRTALVLTGALALVAAPLAHPKVAAAATAAGTVISNTATATYSDVNATTYTTQSNTVTTTVWNAPSLTVSNPASQNVAPSDVVTTNAFVLTNTGNANGTFVMTADAAFSGAAGANASLANAGAAYIIVGGTTCTVAAPCTLANLNTALAGATYNAIVPGGTVSIDVEYKVASTTTPTTGTITTTLTADIVYPVNGSIPATTSATASGAESDNLQVDARLDIQKAVTAPTSSGSNITWTINANDGGSFAARDLTTVKTFLGSANPGVMILDKIPAYGGTTLTLVSATTTTCPAGDTCSVYYSATGASGSWSTTFSSTANYVAVLLSGGTGGLELASNPSGSTGAGAVSAPQVVINIVTGQPSGSGSADPNSVSNIANSVIGGNKDSAGNVPVIAPTIASGTYDSTTPSLTTVVANPTSSTGTTPPGGASNTVSTQAWPQWTVYNGPYNVPAATGNYGGGAATNMLDFTESGFLCTATPATNGTCTNAAAIAIPMTVQNTSTKTEPVINLTTPAPPAGWTVAFYAASGCTGGGATFPTCTKGAAITNFTNLASGVSVNYLAVYTATAVTAFTPVAFDITAAGTGGSGTGTETNDSYDVLYPGGALKLTKSVVVTSTNCPSGVTAGAGATCPGGVLTYTLAFADLAPAGLAAGGTGLGTEPAFATNAITLSSV
ncbi:MAG: hypothetical protein ACLPYS_20885, partial [Vulcanimicrobiaceae bacterium]